MIISKFDLPSKGKFIKDADNLDIKPLTFKKLLDYIESVEVGEIPKLIKDLKLLVSNGMDLSKISLLDMDYAIFMMKSITISDDIKFNSSGKCNSCGSIYNFSFNLSDIKFMDFEDHKIPRKIKLNDEYYEIKIPSVKEFLTSMEDVYRINPSIKLNQLKLYTLFELWESSPSMVQNLVDNSTRESAANLIYLDDLCFGRVEPIQCKCTECGYGHRTNIDILGLTENFFSDFLRHFRLDEHQILFE
jgi:hypothetical protein